MNADGASQAEAELLSSHDSHQMIADRLGISANVVRFYCDRLVASFRLGRCTHIQHGDGESEQPSSWDPYGQQQDPRQWQGEPYGYQQPYGQQPRQPSFMPDPQHGTPPGQPAYQGGPQYPPQSYGRDPYPQGQPYGQQPYLPQGHHWQSYQEAPRKRRRVFLWVFLGIQALFIVWIIVGVATVHTGPTQAQLAQGCYSGNWYPLFKNQADCVKHYGGALNDAGTAGKAIGVGLIIVFWMVVDVILGISYGIYKLARRAA